MPKVVIDTCPYCLREAQTLNTKEHVIPKSWFIHESFPCKNPIIIDVCESCNNTKAAEDEWMRMWLTTLAAEKSPAAEQVLMGKIKKSVEKGNFRPQFQSHYNNMELTDRLPSDIYLPKPMTKIAISDQDWKRVRTYVDQVVKGLFYAKNGSTFPSTHDLQTFFALDMMLEMKPQFKPMFTSFPRTDWQMDDAYVFFYGMSKTADAEMWLCATVFYNAIPFLTFIGPSEWIRQKRLAFGSVDL